MSTRAALILTAVAATLLVGSPVIASPAADLSSAVAPASGLATTATSSALNAIPLTRDRFLACVSRDIAAHFNLEGNLEVELLRQWAPPQQVAADWNVTVTEYPSVPASSMMVRCRISADGAVATEQSYIIRAALWRDAWATHAPLTIGATFDPALLETRRVDMLRERDALPAAVGDRSYIFARGVAAGYLLTWRDVARRPLVKRGEMVDVSAVDGALSITMKGLAMENGARGEMVTVRNPDSRKDFSAVVVDENHVQVRF